MPTNNPESIDETIEELLNDLYYGYRYEYSTIPAEQGTDGREHRVRIKKNVKTTPAQTIDKLLTLLTNEVIGDDEKVSDSGWEYGSYDGTGDARSHGEVIGGNKLRATQRQKLNRLFGVDDE